MSGTSDAGDSAAVATVEADVPATSPDTATVEIREPTSAEAGDDGKVTSDTAVTGNAVPDPDQPAQLEPVQIGAEADKDDTLLDSSGVALLTPVKQPANGKGGSDKPTSKRGKLSKDDPRLKKARMATSLEDISSLRLWKGIVAEFVGTLLLTMIGCGSCIDLNPWPVDKTDPALALLVKPVPVVQIALCFGLSVATIVWAIGHVSGGHINPAVTAAMLATRKISLVKGVFFILFQLIGAVVGAGILYGLVPDGFHGMLGATMVNSKLTPGQGVGVELLITFVLVFVVFASCDSKRKDLRGSAPLTIGLSVTMCHLFAVEFTGSSMNTARSFGPAVVVGEWRDHWVYWVGPILGGMVAGVLYDNLFAVNASLAKAKACVLSSDYDDEKYKASKTKVRIIEEVDPEPEEEGDGEELALTEKKADSDPSNA